MQSLGTKTIFLPNMYTLKIMDKITFTTNEIFHFKIDFYSRTKWVINRWMII